MAMPPPPIPSVRRRSQAVASATSNSSAIAGPSSSSTQSHLRSSSAPPGPGSVVGPPTSKIFNLRLAPNPNTAHDLTIEQGRLNSLVNLTLSCDNGSLPVHRFIFTGVSPVLRQHLEYQVGHYRLK